MNMKLSEFKPIGQRGTSRRGGKKGKSNVDADRGYFVIFSRTKVIIERLDSERLSIAVVADGYDDRRRITIDVEYWDEVKYKAEELPDGRIRIKGRGIEMYIPKEYWG